MPKGFTLEPSHSVLALYALLSKVAETPSLHTEYVGLKEALGRQSRLARLDLPACGIFPVGALNTLKRVSEVALKEQGGFLQLDAMRRTAFSEVEKFCSIPSQPKRSSRDELRMQLAQAKARNRILREDLAFLTDRLEVTLNLAKRCAMAADHLTQATYKKQRMEILLSLGLRKLSNPGDTADDVDDPAS